MRRALVLAALASFGCGQTSGNDAGADVQAFDQITTGCSMGVTKVYEYKGDACVPQLERGTSCNGSICSWTVIIPCTAPNDAAADSGDDGGLDCMSICNQAQPPDPHSLPGFCQPGATNEVICGGCGV